MSNDRTAVEKIVLARSGKSASAVIEVALLDSGRWCSGWHWSAGSASGASARFGTYASRQEAIDAEILSARRYFQKRLRDATNAINGDGTFCYAAASVRRDAIEILAQLDRRITPQQMDMFAPQETSTLTQVFADA
jgi:hypothetical protein